MNRTENAGLGEISILPSLTTKGLQVVAIGTTVSGEYCITDPFSTPCSGARVKLADYGVTKDKARDWWEAVQDLDEEGLLDRSSVYAPASYIVASLTNLSETSLNHHLVNCEAQAADCCTEEMTDKERHQSIKDMVLEYLTDRIDEDDIFIVATYITNQLIKK